MTFEEMLAQVVEVLRREHRVSYRALRRRLQAAPGWCPSPGDLEVEMV